MNIIHGARQSILIKSKTIINICGLVTMLKCQPLPIVCLKLTYIHMMAQLQHIIFLPAITGLTSDDETIVVLIDTIPVEF